MRGRRILALAAAGALLLSGCSWMDGSYVSVTPHRVGTGQMAEGGARAVRSYMELRSALVGLIEDGITAVSYTHLTLPTTAHSCRSRWSPYH